MHKSVVLLALSAILLLPSAQATPPRPGAGQSRVRVEVSPNFDPMLRTSGVQPGTEVPLTISLDFPRANACLVSVLLMPVDGTAEIKGAPRAQRDFADSRITPNGGRWEFTCQQLQVDQRGRLIIPLGFRPLGDKGAAANVEVRMTSNDLNFGGASLGYGTLVLAAGADGKFRYGSSEQINETQAKAIQSVHGDKKIRLENLFANPSVLPLDPSLVPDKTSDSVELDLSE